MEEKNWLAILLLCIDLRLDSADPKPFHPREWWNVHDKIPDTIPFNSLMTLDWKALYQRTGIDAGTCLRMQLLWKRRKEAEALLADFRERNIKVVPFFSKDYPGRLLQVMGHTAPPILFVVGNERLPGQKGISVTGMRDIDTRSRHFAEYLGRRCAREKHVLFSGMARGTDRTAMFSALRAGGRAVGVIPGNLESVQQNRETAPLINSGRLTLLTPYHPLRRFTPGKALGRNKIIYSLGRNSIVIASRPGRGGTWRGALTAVKSGRIQVFVRIEKDVPKGNPALIRAGGYRLEVADFKACPDMDTFFARHATPA